MPERPGRCDNCACLHHLSTDYTSAVRRFTITCTVTLNSRPELQGNRGIRAQRATCRWVLRQHAIEVCRGRGDVRSFNHGPPPAGIHQLGRDVEPVASDEVGHHDRRSEHRGLTRCRCRRRATRSGCLRGLAWRRRWHGVMIRRRGASEHSHASRCGEQTSDRQTRQPDRSETHATPFAPSMDCRLVRGAGRDGLRWGDARVRHTGPVGVSGSVLANCCLSVCAPRDGIGL